MLTRPKLLHTRLYRDNYAKGGVLKRYYGTITPFRISS
jgi:hypothetical protein